MKVKLFSVLTAILLLASHTALATSPVLSVEGEHSLSVKEYAALPDGISDIEVTFEYHRPAKSNLIFTITDAGVIRSFSIDGVERTLTDLNYPYLNSHEERLWLENGAAVAGEGGWLHKARIVISGVTEKSVHKK